ncbi:MAG: hypothetical protein ACHP7N_15510 [Caulobacterales bacterium]
MRASVFAAIAASMLLLPSIAASDPAANQATNAAADDSGNPNSRLLTPQQEGHKDFVHGVIEQPARDFNIVRSKIPPVLRQAMADPYERPAPNTCQGIDAQVRILYDALGPDLDEPASTDHPGLMTRGGSAAKTGSLDAMRSAEQSYIPFDGFIRILSGAERHDRVVMAAIQAGSVRRAYLKGLGEARGCLPPGVPRHLAHPTTVAVEDESPPRPKYPTH